MIGIQSPGINDALIQRITRLENQVRTLTARQRILRATYTPTYYGLTTAGATTYGLQQGWYWLFDTVVFVTGVVVWTAATGTGQAAISLPYAPSATAGFRASCNVRTITVTFANGSVQAIVSAANNYFTMESPLTNAASTAIAVEAAGNVTFSCFYGV